MIRVFTNDVTSISDARGTQRILVVPGQYEFALVYPQSTLVPLPSQYIVTPCLNHLVYLTLALQDVGTLHLACV